MAFPALLLAAALGPAGAAFYQPPSPLPPAPHGAIVWARPWTEGAAPADAAENVLLLYHTVGADGRDTAVSGTLSIPKGAPPAGGWPVISWTHGTTGNGPLCAPSRYQKPDGEQRLMEAFVAAGYAVVQTDYEGNGTPGIHPYFVLSPYAHDASDMVRAARAYDRRIGARWLVAGHSEGGAAALGSGAYAPGWTPELHLVGALAFAPASHFFAMLQDMKATDRPASFFPLFFALMVQGAAAADPSVKPEEIFYPSFTGKFAELQQRCFWQLDKEFSWLSLVPAEQFRRGADTAALERALVANEPGALRIGVPVLVVQGAIDDEVSPASSAQMADALCARGASVELDLYPGKDHFTALEAARDASLRWVAARFAGVPVPNGCRSSTVP